MNDEVTAWGGDGHVVNGNSFQLADPGAATSLVPSTPSLPPFYSSSSFATKELELSILNSGLPFALLNIARPAIAGLQTW